MNSLKFGLLAAAASVAFGATAANADVTFAVAGPITGQYAAFGEQMRRGAEMAVADINAAGGVNGEQIVLEVGDDACDPKQAVAVANQLASAGVGYVAGHFCSGSSIPASQVYNEEDVIMMSPASTNPQLTEQGFENVFRSTGRDDQQGIVAAEYIAENFGDKKIAIVHDKQTYSKGLADATKENLNKAGIQEVLYETVNPGEKDYSALVTKLKQAGVDVLYYGGYHPEAGLIVRQMRDQGLNTTLVSGDALNTEEFWSITGPAGAGTLFTFGSEPRNRPEAAEVVERFRAQGYEPEGYTLYTYATVQALVDAIEAAGSTDPAAVIDALHNTEFSTVIGPLSFDEKGDRTSLDYVFYEWQDGKYQQVSQ